MRQSYPTAEQMQQSIDMIAASVENEKSDAMFYDWLIQNIPKIINYEVQLEVAQIIESIKNDELGHNQIFKMMYKQLTGKDVPEAEEEQVEYPQNFIDGISKALKGELDAVKRYRVIIEGLPNNSYRDQVFKILTDELRHANLYNYIYTSVLMS